MGEVIQFPGAQRVLPGMPTPPPAPAVLTPTKAPVRMCWNCANTRATPKRGERFCTPCQIRGEDTPLISCRHDGCNTVTKRRRPGQQFFDCPQHQGFLNEKAAFDEGGAENV